MSIPFFRKRINFLPPTFSIRLYFKLSNILLNAVVNRGIRSWKTISSTDCFNSFAVLYARANSPSSMDCISTSSWLICVGSFSVERLLSFIESSVKLVTVETSSAWKFISTSEKIPLNGYLFFISSDPIYVFIPCSSLAYI